MKRFWTVIVASALALTLGVSTADAKRLGGGGSFGRQSQNVSRQPQAPAQSQAANAAKPATPAAAPSSPWKGILGGALLGLGLGALLSHLGLGGAMAGMLGTILMIALLALAVMFIIRLFRRNAGGGNQPAFAGAAPGNASTPEIGSRLDGGQPAALQGSGYGSGAAAAAWGVPADFDTDGFLRQSKTYFLRMQAAWDSANVNDIREFTTPEMFAELRLQLQERGASANHTDVTSLEAQLLGIETVGSDYMASVRFSGMIKESDHAPAEPFAEVWNLSKPVNGQSGWLLGGIQQVN